MQHKMRRNRNMGQTKELRQNNLQGIKKARSNYGKISYYSKGLTVAFQYDLGLCLHLIPTILNGVQALQNKSRSF